ncbi:peptidyl-tRNA hydrolase 2 mitochondrial-like, partial [Trifolium medium]|nr:peptidyl-tRNA hydrolase 2 mitochondrial-like [Trifolium medium]
VLVVRQDLKMRTGKIASQCAHAATGMYAELTRSVSCQANFYKHGSVNVMAVWF